MIGSAFVCPVCGNDKESKVDRSGDKIVATASCEDCNRKYTYEGTVNGTQVTSSKGCKTEVLDPSKEPKIEEQVIPPGAEFLSDVLCPDHNIPLFMSSGLGKTSCPECIREVMNKSRASIQNRKKIRWGRIMATAAIIGGVIYAAFYFGIIDQVIDLVNLYL